MNKHLANKKIIHSSWLFMWTSLGIVIGTYASLYSLGFVGYEWVIIGVCLLIVALMRRTYVAVLFAIAGGVIIGLCNGGNQLLRQSAYEPLIGQEITARGRVIEDPSYDSEGDLRFRLKNVQISGVDIDGELWVGTSNKIDLKRSDDVTVSGKLSSGFGTIPAALFRAEVSNLERQDYADVARDTRDWFASGIREGVKEPEASLGSGFLLGQKSALPEKLDLELRLLGLTHIVVASGYNLSILVRYGRRLFSRVSRFTGLAVSATMVLGFANITGFSPSMTRASLITGLSLMAWYFGRKFHPLVLLSVSAAVTVLLNPTYAWGDIGWMLSFTSFVGVIMFSPLVHSYFWGDSEPSVIRQVFIETTSAQLLTLPIIAFVFGQYSPLALLANVLILPLIPLAMLLTFIGGIGGVLGLGASVFAWPAEILLSYMTLVVDKLAMQPLAESSIEFGIELVVMFYLAIIAVMIFLWRRSGHHFRDYNVIE